MKLPGFMFYPGDWLKDPNLLRINFTQKGLWVDLLCIAFCSDEPGHFSTGGKPWSLEEIAGSVRGNVKTNLKNLKVLIDKGVARIDDNGCVYNARMVRDESLRATRRECGALGGNPNLVNQKSEKSLSKQNVLLNQITEYENEKLLSSNTNNKRKTIPRERNGRCTLQEAIDFCVELGLQKTDGEWFFAKCEGCGWTNGGKPIRNCKQTIRAWMLRGYMPSQKGNAPQPEPKKLRWWEEEEEKKKNEKANFDRIAEEFARDNQAAKRPRS